MLESAAEQFGGKEEQEIKNICLVSHFPIVKKDFLHPPPQAPTPLQLPSANTVHSQCKILDSFSDIFP